MGHPVIHRFDIYGIPCEIKNCGISYLVSWNNCVGVIGSLEYCVDDLALLEKLAIKSMINSAEIAIALLKRELES